MIDIDNLDTEHANPLTINIDQLSTIEMIRLMNREDSRVITAIKKEEKKIESLVDRCALSLKTGGRIIYVGAGTSGRLGVLDASECPPTFGVDNSMVIGIIAGGDQALRDAIEGAEDDHSMGRRVLETYQIREQDTVIGLTASGRTPFVLGALSFAQEAGAHTGAISCTTHAEISKRVDHPIEVLVGPEIITGSTRLKAGTATKLILNMISTLSMIKIGKVYKNYMVDLKPTNQKLHTRAINMIQELAEVPKELAEKTLYEAKNNVKVALVMLILNQSYEEAVIHLEEAGGHIRQLID